MNKNIKLAVAGAVLALTASAANAGIVIPAGEWTLDVSGNVNMYSSWGKAKGRNDITGAVLPASTVTTDGKTANGMGNGLLPNYLSFTGSTRQNDLDVAFTISLQPGSANNRALTTVLDQGNGAGARPDNGGLNNRQMFITFGDKSWGSVKIGKDIGLFASDAILNDITLLGVGGAAAGGGNTSLGRIGYGYIYPDFKPQISYTTPNFSGFSASAGISQAFISTGRGSVEDITSSAVNAAPTYEGKASYSFNANGVDGKVWVSGLAQKVGQFTGAAAVGYGNEDNVAYAGDIGAKVSVASFDVVGYYYGGSGVGTTGQMLNGYGLKSGGTRSVEARDSDGGYVQATYTTPIKTKLALSWGQSNLDKTSSDLVNLVDSNEMWDAMVIHPLTKHLNLVGEWSFQESKAHNGIKNQANVGSLGAILFF